MTTSDNESVTIHKCSYCGKETSKKCGACHGAPAYEGGIVETTWYCSSNCQAADRKSPTLCKAAEARKVLFRAGDIAQRLFYIWREIFFDKFIIKVQRNSVTNPAQIIIYEAPYDRDAFITFPDTFFPTQMRRRRF